MKAPKLSRKLLASFICIILVCSALSAVLTYQFVRGQSSSNLSPLTLSAGPAPGAPTYTIFSDGSGGYYAKDAQGAIKFSSTDGSVVINDVAAIGGSILVNGNVTCNNPVTLSVGGTSLYSVGQGNTLIFVNTNGILVTANEVSIQGLSIIQSGYARTKTGITIAGTNAVNLGYEMLSQLDVWGWNTALQLNYAWNSAYTAIDTTYSFTAVNLWGQSVSNTFTNCLFMNILSGAAGTQPTVIFQRDANLDLYPEGNTISNSVIFGGSMGLFLEYANYNKISNCVIDSWNLTGCEIAGSFDNTLVGNWIGCSSPSQASCTAVLIVTGSKDTLDSNTFLATQYGVYAYGSTADLVITNNKFTYAASTADIYILNCAGVMIANNDLHSQTGSSAIAVFLQNDQQVTVNGNSISHKNTGIDLYNSNYITCSYNIVNQTANNGIIVDQCHYCVIDGNDLSNIGNADGTYFGVYLADSSTYDTISSNVITNTASPRMAWAIYEPSGGDYNLFQGNIIPMAGVSVGAIDITGAHSVRGTNLPATG